MHKAFRPNYMLFMYSTLFCLSSYKISNKGLSIIKSNDMHENSTLCHAVWIFSENSEWMTLCNMYSAKLDSSRKVNSIRISLQIESSVTVLYPETRDKTIRSKELMTLAL